MWTCSKCGGNVGDQFTACQSCGTGVDGTAAPPPPTVDTLNGAPRPGVAQLPLPELGPVVPPPMTLQDRLLRAAKAGAIYGALYGAMYVLIMWIGMTALLRGAARFEAPLGEQLARSALYGAAIGVPIAVVFRLIFPYPTPKNK